MKKNIFSEKLRFSLPFFLVFLIPFICLSLILHYYFVVRTQHQLEESFETIALQIEDDILSTTTRLNRISNNIGTNPKLTNFYISHRAILNETSETLKQYTTIDNTIDEIILFYPTTSDKYFSSQGLYSKDSFLKTKLNLNNNNIDKIENLFNSDETGFFLLKDARTQQLILLSNINNSNYQGGKVIYLFDSSRFFNSITKHYDLNFVFFNHNNQILYSSKELGEFEQLLKNHKEESNFLNTINEDLLVTTNTIGLPFKSILLIDKNAFYPPLNRIKFLFYFGILSLFLMGILASYYFSEKQYTPVKQISEELKAILPSSFKDSYNVNKNIYHDLQSDINLIIENQNELSFQIKRQKSQYINSLYKFILEGHSLDAIDHQVVLSNFNSYNSSQYFTILFEYEYSNEYIDDLFPISNSEFEAFTVSSRYIKDYNLLFCHFNNEKISYETVCERIYHCLNPELILPIRMFVGRIGIELSNFYDSYLDTLFLVEQNFKNNNNNSIIYFEFDNLNSQIDDINYIFSTNFIKLRNSIENGNTEICTNTIKEIINIAKNPTANQIMAKSLLYEIVNCLMKYVNEYNLIIPSKIYDKLSSNFNPYNAYDTLITFGVFVCENIQSILEHKENNKHNDILNFISSNYRNFDFSIEFVSEHLQISTNIINQVLRDYSGVTFSKYIQQLRFNYVKENLISSNETIKNIITNSGYLDASNFTRQFKTIYGCTPGQYRKNNMTVNK